MPYRSKQTRFDDRMALRSLAKGVTAIIEYKQTHEDDPIVLFEDYPQQIVQHFAPSLQATTTFDPFHIKGKQVTTTAFTITGGRMQAIRDIFEWMRDCCDGDGMLMWPGYRWWDQPFNKYYHLRYAAQAIGCTVLENEFQFRMQRLSNKRLHSDDVEVTYNEAGRGSDMANYLVDHVASFFLDQTQVHRDLDTYLEICTRNKSFNEDMDAVIGPRLAMRQKIANDRSRLYSTPSYYQQQPIFHGHYFADQVGHYEFLGHAAVAQQPRSQQQQPCRAKRNKKKQKATSRPRAVNKDRIDLGRASVDGQSHTVTTTTAVIKSMDPSSRHSSDAISRFSPEEGQQGSNKSPTGVAASDIVSNLRLQKFCCANDGRKYSPIDLTDAGVSNQTCLPEKSWLRMHGTYQRGSIRKEKTPLKLDCQSGGNCSANSTGIADAAVDTDPAEGAAGVRAAKSSGDYGSVENIGDASGGKFTVNNMEATTKRNKEDSGREKTVGQKEVMKVKNMLGNKDKATGRDVEKVNGNSNSNSNATDKNTTAATIKPKDKMPAGVVVGVDPASQARTAGGVSHIKNKAAKRRQKKRLASADSASGGTGVGPGTDVVANAGNAQVY